MELTLIHNEQPKIERDATAALQNYGRCIAEWEAIDEQMAQFETKRMPIPEELGIEYHRKLCAIGDAQRRIVRQARALAGLPYDPKATVFSVPFP